MVDSHAKPYLCWHQTDDKLTERKLTQVCNVSGQEWKKYKKVLFRYKNIARTTLLWVKRNSLFPAWALIAIHSIYIAQLLWVSAAPLRRAWLKYGVIRTMHYFVKHEIPKCKDFKVSLDFGQIYRSNCNSDNNDKSTSNDKYPIVDGSSKYCFKTV